MPWAAIVAGAVALIGSLIVARLASSSGRADGARQRVVVGLCALATGAVVSATVVLLTARSSPIYRLWAGPESVALPIVYRPDESLRRVMRFGIAEDEAVSVLREYFQALLQAAADDPSKRVAVRPDGSAELLVKTDDWLEWRLQLALVPEELLGDADPRRAKIGVEIRSVEGQIHPRRMLDFDSDAYAALEQVHEAMRAEAMRLTASGGDFEGRVTPPE